MRFLMNKLWLCLLLAVMVGCGGNDTGSVDGPSDSDNDKVAANDNSQNGDTDPKENTDNDDDQENAKPSNGEDNPPSDDPPSNDPEKPAINNTVAPAPVGNGIDTRFVGDDFFAALIINPKQIYESKIVQSIPAKTRDEILKEFDGFDPSAIEQIALFAVPMTMDEMMMMFAPIGGGEFHDPSIEGDFPEELPERFEDAPKDGGDDAGAAFEEETESSDGEAPTGQAAAEEKTPDFDGLFVGLENEPEPDEDEDQVAFQDQEPEGDIELEGPKGPAFGDKIGAVLRFVNAEGAKFIKSKIEEDSEKAEHAGQKLYLNPSDPSFAAWLPDDRTIVITGVARIKNLIDANGSQKSPLIEKLAATPNKADIFAVALIDPIRGQLDELVAMATLDEEGNPTPGLPNFAGMLGGLKSLALSTNVSDGNLLDLSLEATDGETRDVLKGGIDFLLAIGKTFGGQGLDEIKEEPDLAFAADLGRQLLNGVSTSKVDQSVVVSIPRPDGLEEVVTQALAQAEQAAAQARRLNSLKMIGLAMHNYHDTYRMLPSNKPMREGNPASSWRVDLLPYLEYAFLYEEYKFDEAWDSENNKSVMNDITPEVYSNANDGKSTIVLITGEGTAYPKEGPLSFVEITDGLSNTIFAVRVGPESAIAWTEPKDLVFNKEKPLACLGKIPEGGLDVVLFDGSVQTLPANIDADTFRKLVDPRDGQEVNLGN